VATFAVIVAPWQCYQKFVDPPGNRLLKWHIAGVIPIDDRGFFATLIDSYRHLSGAAWWHARVENFIAMLGDEWGMGLWRSGGVFWMRVSELERFFYALSWWLPAALLLVWSWVMGRGAFWGSSRRAVGWTLLGLVGWDVLMFIPGSAIMHQGAMVWPVLLAAVIAAGLWRLSRIVFGVVALGQAAWFVRVWFPWIGSDVVETRMAADITMMVTAMAVIAVIWILPRETPPADAVVR
jgi:hypothetical protein